MTMIVIMNMFYEIDNGRLYDRNGTNLLGTVSNVEFIYPEVATVWIYLLEPGSCERYLDIPLWDLRVS